jgi:PASTA domain
MRDEMKALDDLEMGDLWTEARRRTPGGPDPDPRRSPASRIVAAVTALAIAAAAFAVVKAAFGDDHRAAAAGPDPAAVCPSTSHLDPAWVDLAGTEVRTDVLAEPGASRDQLTLLPATVIDAFFTDPEARLSDAPTDGWRPILEREQRVVVAAPMPEGGSWYYVDFAKDAGEWSLAGWGISVPTATPAQRGAGLRLDWGGDVVYSPRSNPEIRLVNDRDEDWVDGRGEYWAIVHLFDPLTGEEIRQPPTATGGVGRRYRVPPGGSVGLPLAFGGMSSVPPGTYTAVACVPQLALASPLGTVTVPTTTEPSPSSVEAGSIVMPDLVGLRDQRALLRLDRLGLHPVALYRIVEDADRWQVVLTDPAPGATVPRGGEVRILIATTVTPLPDGAADVLSCPAADRVSFGGPRIRILPAGAAYVAGNTQGILGTDVVEQATSTHGDEGLWHVIRDGEVLAVIDYPSLDGQACAGSGIAGA